MESVCMPDTTRQDSVATCSSDGSLDASPLTNDGGCSVTPDNSRSCTPSSLNCLLSPISKDSRSADSSQCECKDALPPPVICKWKDCDFEDFEDQGILEHIKSKHVYSQEGKKVSCLWEGCKVYSVQSRSQAWLERHVVCHCGDKPFRCIVDGCSLSFTSHKGLEKHVNNHFKLQQLPNQRPSKSREDTPTKMWKKRRCRKSRPPGGTCFKYSVHMKHYLYYFQIVHFKTILFLNHYFFMYHMLCITMQRSQYLFRYVMGCD